MSTAFRTRANIEQRSRRTLNNNGAHPYFLLLRGCGAFRRTKTQNSIESNLTGLLEAGVLAEHELLQQLVDWHLQVLALELQVHLADHVVIALQQFDVCGEELFHLLQVVLFDLLEFLRTYEN